MGDKSGYHRSVAVGILLHHAMVSKGMDVNLVHTNCVAGVRDPCGCPDNDCMLQWVSGGDISLREPRRLHETRQTRSPVAGFTKQEKPVRRSPASRNKTNPFAGRRLHETRQTRLMKQNNPFRRTPMQTRSKTTLFAGPRQVAGGD